MRAKATQQQKAKPLFRLKQIRFWDAANAVNLGFSSTLSSNRLRSFKSFKVQKANPIDENASRKFKRQKSVLGRERSFCFELDILMFRT